MKTIFFIILLLIAGCTDNPWENKYTTAYVDSYGTLYISEGYGNMAKCIEDDSYILSPETGYCIDNHGRRVKLRYLSDFNLDGIDDSYCYKE